MSDKTTANEFEFGIPHLGAVGIGSLATSSDCPDWITEWSIWLKNLLVPDYNIRVGVADQPPGGGSGVVASTRLTREYLDATIIMRRDLEDDVEGHLTICHEFSHIFMARLGLAQTLMSQSLDAALKANRGVHGVHSGDDFEPQTKIVQKAYDDSEEETVVRMSRILVGLRYSLIESQIETLDAKVECKKKLRASKKVKDGNS